MRSVMGAAAPARKSFSPGQTAPVSGVYRVRHAHRHRSVHEVTIEKGQVFPPCRVCGAEVTFRLAYPASNNKPHAQ